MHVLCHTRPYCCLLSLSHFPPPLSPSLSYFLLHMQASPVNCLSSHTAHSPQHTVHCHTLHHITHHIITHSTHLHTYVCTYNNRCNFIRVHMISTNDAMPLVISMRPPHAHMHVSTLTQALTSPHLSLSLSLSHSHTREYNLQKILTYTKYTHMYDIQQTCTQNICNIRARAHSIFLFSSSSREICPGL